MKNIRSALRTTFFSPSAYVLICLLATTAHAIFPGSDDPHYAAYLDALQTTPGAIAALRDLGQPVVPQSDAPNLFVTEWILGELVDADGNPTLAYTNPKQAALNWIHVDNYIQAIYKTPGAVAALQEQTGIALPTDRNFPYQFQIRALTQQLFDANGNPTLTYTNPTAAAKGLASSSSTTHSTSKTNTAELALGIGLLVALGAALFIYGLPVDLLPLLGIGGVAALALFLIFNSHKKEQALGTGDAPVLTRTTTPSSTQTTSQMTAQAPGATTLEQPSDSNNNVALSASSPSITEGANAAVPQSAAQIVIGKDTPLMAYKPFYQVDRQSPTGLSATPQVVAAVAQQKNELEVAGNSNPSSSPNRAAVTRAAVINKNVTLGPQNE